MYLQTQAVPRSMTVNGQCFLGNHIPCGRINISDFNAGLYPFYSGFLCMVNAERDKPQLPTAEDLAKLQADETVAAFLRNEPET